MPDWTVYLDAIREGDHRAALDIVDRARAEGADLATVYLDLLQPAMREIGRLWQDNELTVADEHLATAVTQTVMAHLFSSGVRGAAPAADRPTLIAACVDTERHEMGLRMVCDIMELEGWHVVYLGATVPVGSLLSLMQRQPPAVLALSATIPTHLPRLRATIAAVRDALGAAAPPILVGGRPFLDHPDLAASVGADATAADARAAAALIRRFAADRRPS